MNIIGITGHTKGIGLGLYNAFINLGHIVHGYSRSNDYDLSHEITIDRIILSISESNQDTFILNAEHDYTQVKLLYALDRLWAADKNKTIMVIGSISATYPNREPPHEYSIQKIALDKAVEQLHIIRPYRLINIRPGYVDTTATKAIKGPKLPVSDVVNIVSWALDAPTNMLIRNITFSPR